MPSRDRAFIDINRVSKRFAEVAYSEAQASGGKVDMTKIATWYSFDVINIISFGESTEMLDSNEYRWLPLCLQETSVFLYAAGYAPCVRFWRSFLGSSWPHRLAIGPAIAAQRYADFAAERVTKRRNRLQDEKFDEVQRQDIFESLIQTGLYIDLDLRADSSLLIAAGSDAVRLTIVATLFYWLRNPGVMRKAVEEIRACVSDAPDDVTESTIASLKYLRAWSTSQCVLPHPNPAVSPVRSRLEE